MCFILFASGYAFTFMKLVVLNDKTFLLGVLYEDEILQHHKAIDGVRMNDMLVVRAEYCIK